MGDPIEETDGSVYLGKGGSIHFSVEATTHCWLVLGFLCRPDQRPSSVFATAVFWPSDILAFSHNTSDLDFL